MRPVIAMLPAGPLWTTTSPERVSTSRLAPPLTCNVFWKCPCSDAKAAVVASRSASATADTFANALFIDISWCELFITKRIYRSHVGRALCRVHARGYGDKGKRD